MGKSEEMRDPALAESGSMWNIVTAGGIQGAEGCFC